MASVNTVLRNKTNKQGLHPIVICVTQNRKRALFHTGQYLDKKFWDDSKRVVKKSHPNSKRINNLISSKLSDFNSIMLDCIHTFGENFTLENFKSLQKKTSSNNSFFTFSERYFDQLEEAHKHSRVNSERPLVKKIKELRNYKDLSFDEITVPYLRSLTAKLRHNNSLSDRSIANILMFIRNLYNRAIDENLANREAYPFGNSKGKIKIKIPESVKIGLTKEEVLGIENIDLADKQHLNHARNVWLFSYYLAGMRVADVLKIKWSDIHDGRLYYKMGKNNKTLSLKIADKLQGILDQYQGKSDSFIFPELNTVDFNKPKVVLSKTRTANHKFNKNLKKIAVLCEIDKSLSMHIARHTFGNIAGDKINPLMLQKLYRHSDLKTTINYQANFIHKEADDALDKVLNS